MKFRKDFYNLVYEDVEGKEVKLRSRKDVRAYQREDGKHISQSFLRDNYEYKHTLDHLGNVKRKRNY